MKKKPHFRLPVVVQDLSSELDRRLLLLAEILCAADSYEPMLGFQMLQAIGNELHSYLRSRMALEECLGRTSLYYDDEYLALVKEYRRRLNRTTDSE